MSQFSITAEDEYEVDRWMFKGSVHWLIKHFKNNQTILCMTVIVMLASLVVARDMNYVDEKTYILMVGFFISTTFVLPLFSLVMYFLIDLTEEPYEKRKEKFFKALIEERKEKFSNGLVEERKSTFN